VKFSTVVTEFIFFVGIFFVIN